MDFQICSLLLIGQVGIVGLVLQVTFPPISQSRNIPNNDTLNTDDMPSGNATRLAYSMSIVCHYSMSFASLTDGI